MLEFALVRMVHKHHLERVMQDYLDNFEEENMVNDLNATCVYCNPKNYDADDMSCNARIARWIHERYPDIDELWVQVDF